MSGNKIALSETIENLRDQLIETMEKGKGKEIKLKIEEMELEFKYTVSREGEGKAGVKFWVVDAGVAGKVGDSTIQTIKLKLKPVESHGGDALLNDVSRVR